MANRKLTGDGLSGNHRNPQAGAGLAISRAHPSSGAAPFLSPKSDSPDPRRWVLGQNPAPPAPHFRDAPDRPDNPAVAVAVAALEKNANRVSAPPASQAKDVGRKARYALREGLQRITTLPRVAKCGRCRVGESVGVRLGAGGRAHYSGLMSCGSVWLCPVCAAKVDARRAEEVCGVLKQHLANGGAAYFLTFTLPHNDGDRLAATRRLAAKAFKRLLQGRKWQGLKARLGVAGTIRALEVTHGEAGWHPHLHSLFLTDAPLTAEQQEALDAYGFAAWRAAVVAAGHKTPQRQGYCFQVVAGSGIGEYVTKMGAALEITHGAQKQGRHGSRTPFQILADFLQWGDEADLTLWLEYEAAMKGARRLTWSHGLKARYAVTEVSDEALAAEEVGGELLADLSATEWRSVVAFRKQLAVLEAAERFGVSGIRRLLASLPAPPPALRLLRSDGNSG